MPRPVCLGVVLFFLGVDFLGFRMLFCLAVKMVVRFFGLGGSRYW